MTRLAVVRAWRRCRRDRPSPVATTDQPETRSDEGLPLPPLEMRELVGVTDPESFEQPRGVPVFPTLAESQYESVLDFGCGCGRFARRLALAAAPTPKRYLGIDLHRGMIEWDQANLSPRLPGFRFEHHDVFNPGFNPNPRLPRVAPIPAEDQSVTLFIAYSVFTHLLQPSAEHYLGEVARVLRPGGVLLSTWFLFDKALFPMMQDFQNALYINSDDPTNAVIFDRRWLIESLEARGLRIRAATPPGMRGFQWLIEIEPGVGSIPLPEDLAPLGRKPPPVCGQHPSRVRSEAST